MVIEKSLFVKVVCQKSRLSGRKQPVDKICDSAKFRGSCGRKEAANVLVMISFCVSLCHKLGAKIGVVFSHPQPPERRDRTKNGGKY